MTRTGLACCLLAAGMIAGPGCQRDVAVERIAETGAVESEATEPAAPEDVPSAGDTEETTPTESTAPAEAVVGASAPDFIATGLDGEQVSFSEYLGEQNVVVAFSRGNW